MFLVASEVDREIHHQLPILMGYYRNSQLAEHGFMGLFFVLRRAVEEFLFVPTLMIAGFLALAAGTYMVDVSKAEWLTPLREVLKARVFANSEATTGLLEAIAGGIITLTSITISLLLVAVQQSAASMTGQVFDQFLRRRTNQVYFGFFVGLALFSLITLATVNEPFNPVFGATTAFAGTVIALYLLLLLFYTTIHQMRPDEIIDAIREHVLIARERQVEFIAKTQTEVSYTDAISVPVLSEGHGYVTRVNLDLLARELDGMDGEVVLLVSIGSFVGFQDQIAIARSGAKPAAEKIGEVTLKAIELERERDIAYDPAYGLAQLGTIAWTSISTSKSNPAPGLSVIRSLRDIMARWSNEEPPERKPSKLAVVYRDNTFDKLFDTLEDLAVVASESLQHQNFTEVVRTLAISFDRLPEGWAPRAENLILRILSVLGEFALTQELERALNDLQIALDTAGRTETAKAVENALERMSATIGKLGSRGTRVSG